MDFIERLFLTSLDGGSGATEAGVIIALLIAVAVIAKTRISRRTSLKS